MATLKTDLTPRELHVANAIGQAMRFGAALGWWHDSHNPLERTMASNSIDVAANIAARDLLINLAKEFPDPNQE